MTDAGIIEITPGDRATWLALRRGDVTASVAGALLGGVHPYTTPYELWAVKTGRLPEHTDNEATRRGRLLEPVAVSLLKEERPDWQIEYPLGLRYWRDQAARLGATPDCFAVRPDIEGRGIVQLKTASEYAFRENWLDPDSREIALPLWIAVQAIVEAQLTGASWASVALLVVGAKVDFRVIDVPLHQGIMKKLKQAVAQFWAMVASGDHPDIDWLRDGRAVLGVHRQSTDEHRDLSNDAAVDEMVGRYVELKHQASENAAAAEALKPKIVAALGNAATGETAHWQISAKTQNRKPYTVPASTARPLYIKPKDQAA